MKPPVRFSEFRGVATCSHPCNVGKFRDTCAPYVYYVEKERFKVSVCVCALWCVWVCNSISMFVIGVKDDINNDKKKTIKALKKFIRGIANI